MLLWLVDKSASLLFRLRFDKVVDTFKRHYAYRRLEEQKKLFKSVGNGFHMQEGYRIYNPGCITIGNNFHALTRCRIEAIDGYGDTKHTPEIVIGNDVSINDDCHIGCIDRIVIEDGVLIASKVFITDHFHGDSSAKYVAMPPNKRPLVSKGAVIIKKNAWVGESVCIMPGVTIGENVIIGANAVVTRSIPDNAIVVGAPARIINYIQ